MNGGTGHSAPRRSETSTGAQDLRRLASRDGGKSTSKLRTTQLRNRGADEASKWAAYSSSKLAAERWIRCGQLTTGVGGSAHALSRAHKTLGFAPLASEDRYVILTKDALFVARLRARRKKQEVKGVDDDVIAAIITNYDADGSGGLNKTEVTSFLAEASGGRRPTNDELLWVFQMATPQKLKGKELRSDKLELKTEHLQAAALAWTEYREREEEINTIFSTYDKDGDEDLDRNELSAFITDYITQADAQADAGMKAPERPALEKRVQDMVSKVLKECDVVDDSGEAFGDGTITKPEMIKALVIIRNSLDGGQIVDDD